MARLTSCDGVPPKVSVTGSYRSGAGPLLPGPAGARLGELVGEGAPQCGHESASVETCPPHSRHFAKAIVASGPLVSSANPSIFPYAPTQTILAPRARWTGWPTRR